jgi:hypothetical protein
MAGLRVSWTPRAGLEPAPMTMDSRLLCLLSYLGIVLVIYRDDEARKTLPRPWLTSLAHFLAQTPEAEIKKRLG